MGNRSCCSCCVRPREMTEEEVLRPHSTLPRKESKCRKFLRILRTVLAHIFSHIGLVGLVVGYCLLGAFTFEYLESGQEMVLRETMKEERLEFVQKIWEITDRLNVLYEVNWTREADDVMLRYQESLFLAQREHGYDGQTANGGYQKWSFGGALLYSVTVITTIGYGHITPRTTAGRMVTIFYALFGIPLMLLCLTNIGSTLAQTFTFAYTRYTRLNCCEDERAVARRHSRRRRRRQRAGLEPHDDTGTMKGKVNRNSHSAPDGLVVENASTSTSPLPPLPVGTEAKRDDIVLEARLDSTGSVMMVPLRTPGPPSPKAQPTRVPVSLVITIVVGYVCVGALTFSYWEGWDFLDGAYFCFITLSTIGFGDLVPGSSIISGHDQVKLVICCLYLMFGLAVIAMAFSLVQTEVVLGVKGFARRLGLLDDEDSDDDLV